MNPKESRRHTVLCHFRLATVRCVTSFYIKNHHTVDDDGQFVFEMHHPAWQPGASCQLPSFL